MVDLCNSTKGVCLTGMFVTINITLIPSRIQTYHVFKELEVDRV